MANTPIEMSKLHQILKLYSKGMGKKKIAERLGSSKNTVKTYIEQFIQLKSTVEEVLKLTDLELNNLFNPPRIEYSSERSKALYDFFPEAEGMLRRRGVTRMLVYREYKLRYPSGFARSQFYEHYARWVKRVNPTMRIEHVVGDKMYIDFAGEKLPYVDVDTGEILWAEVFIAILGWSQYAYVEALPDQKTPEFLFGCENAIHYFDGTTLTIVPDNMKTAVVKTSKYEPTINENFKAFAEHYGTTVFPARSRKPQDKAHVENMVKIAYQRIYTNLPSDKVLTLKELNERIREHLIVHNNTPIKDLNMSRTERWLMEKNALNTLPEKRFEIRTVRQATVHKSYHVLLSEDKHHYSVPYELIGKKLKLVYSRSQVDIYDNYLLVASHKRLRSPGNYSTQATHMPAEHQHMLNWNPEQYITRARAIHPAVEHYIRKVLGKRAYPQQSYKSCDGILSFDKKFGRDRLINACKRGEDIGHYGYKAIENILLKGIDRYDLEEIPERMPAHENIRGNYY